MNKKVETLMKTAELWAEESYCKRNKVGAVLAKDDRILATGFNGTISGLKNVCEEKIYVYKNKKYKSIFDIIKDFKIKLLNKDQKIKIFFELIDGELTKGYIYLSPENFIKIKKELFEKNQKNKKKILNECYNFETLFPELLKYYVKREEITNEFTLHAEQNVITFCAKNGISTEGTELFVTLSPCKTCAKLIAQSGIKKVYYRNEYRDTEGIEFLQKVGVQVQKLQKN